MEELFTIILLTLISVTEIITMLTGAMLPLAAILIFFILILVFRTVFTMRKRQFWKLCHLLFLINLLNLGYMFLKLGGKTGLYLALFINISGIVFLWLTVAKKPKPAARKVITPKCEIVTYRIEAPSRKEAEGSTPERHGFDIESFIRKLEESRNTEGKDGSAVSASSVKQPSKNLPPKKASVKKKFSPGKFVASRTGRQYHRPRCDWANNIKKENRVWFQSEKEAEKKALTPHWCLKK